MRRPHRPETSTSRGDAGSRTLCHAGVNSRGHDEQLRLAVRNDVRVVFRGEQRVQRHWNGAGADRAEETHGKIDAVFEAEQDALPVDEPARAQQIGELVGAPIDVSPYVYVPASSMTATRAARPRGEIRQQQRVGRVVVPDGLRVVHEALRGEADVLEVAGLAADAADGRRNPRRELPTEWHGIINDETYSRSTPIGQPLECAERLPACRVDDVAGRRHRRFEKSPTLRWNARCGSRSSKSMPASAMTLFHAFSTGCAVDDVVVAQPRVDGAQRRRVDPVEAAV